MGSRWPPGRRVLSSVCSCLWSKPTGSCLWGQEAGLWVGREGHQEQALENPRWWTEALLYLTAPTAPVCRLCTLRPGESGEVEMSRPCCLHTPLWACLGRSGGRGEGLLRKSSTSVGHPSRLASIQGHRMIFTEIVSHHGTKGRGISGRQAGTGCHCP